MIVTSISHWQAIVKREQNDPHNWYIYIVQCSDDTLYTGICCDLARRLREHNTLKNGARYTRARRPVRLVYQEPAASRSAAAQREYRIKQMSADEKRALIRCRTSND